MADVEAGKPELKRGMSQTGKQAQFGDANAEVERIIKFQRNYYYVLKVKKDTPSGEIKANYYKVARLIHPDKCSHPKAKEAAQVLNQAYDTLSNAIKKRAYDAYVDDVQVDAPEGMSYSEWEASNMAAQVKVPKWLETLLRIPGVGIIIALILLPLTLALALVVLVVALVLSILCIPVRCLFGAPAPPPGAEDANAAGGGMSQEEAAAYMAARNAEARKAAGAAPVQQQPPTA
ncbi:hypothetical protein ABPG75_004566 [Micractinium tetrahymenae]